jgi:hypothetical protein
VSGLIALALGYRCTMTNQEREPSNEDVEDENREESPGEASPPKSITPPEGQQEKSHESEDTLSPDEKSGG